MARRFRVTDALTFCEFDGARDRDYNKFAARSRKIFWIYNGDFQVLKSLATRPGNGHPYGFPTDEKAEEALNRRIEKAVRAAMEADGFDITPYLPKKKRKPRVKG